MIVTEIFSKGNMLIQDTDDKWEQFSSNLRQCYSQAIGSGNTSVAALPGAGELLQSVAASGIFGSSVVSGNLERWRESSLKLQVFIPISAAALTAVIRRVALICRQSPSAAAKPPLELRYRLASASLSVTRPRISKPHDAIT
jgi:hypothetical protein